MKQDKFGISLGMGFPEGAIDQIRIAKSVGYDACFTGWNPERMGDWANAMAKQGFTYDEIIEFYYPGTRVDDYED